MNKRNQLSILFLILTNLHISFSAKYQFSSDEELRKFLLTDFEKNQSVECTRMSLASYNYNVDLSDKNNDILTRVTLQNGATKYYFYKKYFKGLNPKSFDSEWLRRQVQVLSKIGDAALPKAEYKRLIRISNSMTSIYGKAKVCPFKRPHCNLEKEGISLDDIEDILASSQNLDELKHFWQGWRDATGRKVKTQYKEYVKLKNRAAVLDGFEDAGAAWRYEFDMPNMENKVEELWSELEPLYLELHTFVLNKLGEFYGNKINIEDGLMPAHITGNNYAQSWEYLTQIMVPFPRVQAVNITHGLKANKYTILDMFETANEFYTSMGLMDMGVSFGPKAMLRKVSNRELVCHASAWDLCDGQDYRISMCTKVNSEDFSVIHHELGHIQYYMQYRNQPVVFRSSPNPGFHEAIGDAIVLSVLNTNHLAKLGLVPKDYVPTHESTINALMEQALSNIPLFPFAYLMDRWRWDVFKGKTDPENWNNLWWHYRRTVQKVKPPAPRTPLDFDPAAKFHIVDDTDYMQYFLAGIFKFQMYRGLCIAAGEFDPKNPKRKPLHECDFYKSKTAGRQLKDGLEVGSSIHWSLALKMITGQTYIDTSAIFDYFEPLIKFLKAENKKRSKRFRGY